MTPFMLKIDYFQKEGDFSEKKETGRLPPKQGLSLPKKRVAALGFKT